MSSGPFARGWGDPAARGYREKHIVKIRAGGRDLYVRREVAHLFAGFIDEITQRGYRIDVGAVDDWGYAYRPIRGYEDEYRKTKDTRYLSNHSWGLAVDLNARTNPMASTLKTDMPSWVVECATKWGLLWGGTYKKRPDSMHYEFVGRPADVSRYPLTEDFTMDAEAEAAFAALNGKYDVLAQAMAHLAEQVEIIRHSVAGYATKNVNGKIVRNDSVRSAMGRIEDLVTPKDG